MPTKAPSAENQKGIKNRDKNNIIEKEIRGAIFLYYTLQQKTPTRGKLYILVNSEPKETRNQDDCQNKKSIEE